MCTYWFKSPNAPRKVFRLRNRTPDADSGSTAQHVYVTLLNHSGNSTKKSRRNDEINTVGTSQQHQAGVTLRFWNAPNGIWSCVKDGRKQQPTCQITGTCPVESRGNCRICLHSLQYVTRAARYQRGSNLSAPPVSTQDVLRYRTERRRRFRQLARVCFRAWENKRK